MILPHGNTAGMKKTFFDTAIDIIRAGKEKYGSSRALSEASGVSEANISRWLKGTRNPRIAEASPIFDILGAKIMLSDESQTREVVFVNPRVHTDYKRLPAPIADDYRAIPLTNMEVAAGPGMAIQEEEELKSWVLIYTQELPVDSSHLIAARVARNQKSMLPGIRPNDIVVIDRSDKNYKRPGIFLVKDPEEGVTLKRIKYFVKRNKPMITFYSDNAEDYPPSTYELSEFGADMGASLSDLAIVGRCIWQWGNLELR